MTIKCYVCDFVAQGKGSLAKLVKHMKSKHPKEWAEAKRKRESLDYESGFC